MARTPRPWYWAARDGWYATVGGMRHLLAKGKANKAEARQAFHRLMADGGRRPDVPPPALAADTLAALFLADFKAAVLRGDRKAVTGEGYFRFLKRFAADFAGRDVAALRPHEVKAWAERPRPRRAAGGAAPRMVPWGPTTMRNALTAVKAAYSWARKMGHLAADPLEHLEKPRARRRSEVLTDEQFRIILAAVRDREFRDLLVALRETGARPGELFALTAAQLDLPRRLAVLREHKTGGKSGKPRVIFLSEAASALLAELAGRHPEGPIFRNARGGAWNRFITKNRFHRLRAKLGYGGEATAYSLRHQFITDGLVRGVPIATMAEMVGHGSTAMISAHYSHLQERAAHMLAAVDQVRPPDSSNRDRPAKMDAGDEARARRRGGGAGGAGSDDAGT